MKTKQSFFKQLRHRLKQVSILAGISVYLLSSLLILHPLVARAAEEGRWIDADTINFRGADYKRRVIDGHESYIRSGDIDDLCAVARKKGSQDVNKYGPKYGSLINLIRDIRNNDKTANHIVYKVALYDSNGNEIPGNTPFNSNPLAGYYYGCKEDSRTDGITLLAANLANADYRWVDGGRIETTDGKKVYTKNGGGQFVWEQDSNTCQELVVPNAGNKTGVLNHNGRRAGNGSCDYDHRDITIALDQKANDPPGSGTLTDPAAAAGGPNQPTCEKNGGDLSWVICPVLRLLDGVVSWFDQQINALLVIPSSYYSDPKLEQTWARLRNLALIILVPIMLLMVVGTAVGSEFFSAYTVRKALPRFLAAVLFITLSWQITQFLIFMTNIVGQGVGGLITSSFGGINHITLASVFNSSGGADTGAAFIGLVIGGVAVSFITIGVVLSYAFIAAIGLFVGYVLLAGRQFLIIGLMLLAPLAILAWIFPGNDKLWKLWWGSFSKLLLLYPLIIVIIASGRVFASIVNEVGARENIQGPDGFASTLIKLVAYIGPYFLIPAVFKFAGGLFATITGMANDKSRGLFDRQKKYRQKAMSETFAKTKGFRRFSDRNALSRGVNRVLGGGAAGPRGWTASDRARARRQANREVGDAQAAEAPGFKLNSMRDGVMKSLQYNNEGEAVAAAQQRHAVRLRGLDQEAADAAAAQAAGTITAAEYANTMERINQSRQQSGITLDQDRADAGAAANIGFNSGTRRAAFVQLGKLGQGVHDIEGLSPHLAMRRAAAAAAGNNPTLYKNLIDQFEFDSKAAGRFDLSRGTGNLGEPEDEQVWARWNNADLYTQAHSKDNSLQAFVDHFQNELSSGDEQRVERATIFFNELQSMKQGGATGANADVINRAVTRNAPLLNMPVGAARIAGIGVPAAVLAQPTREVVQRSAADPNVLERVTVNETLGNNEVVRARTRTYQRPDENNI